MARGKHAASATHQRLQRAEDHVERLTEQLVRYKGFEADARALSQARAEITRLRQQIETDSAERVHELEDRTIALWVERDVAIEHVASVQETYDKIVDKILDLHYGRGPKGFNAFYQDMGWGGFVSSGEEDVHRINALGTAGATAIMRVRRQLNKKCADRMLDARAQLDEMRAAKMRGEVPAKYDQLVFGIEDD